MTKGELKISERLEVKLRYKTYQIRGYRVKVLEEFCREAFLKLWEEEGQWRRSGERIGSSRYAEVYRFEFEGKGYYYKRYLPRGWLEGLKGWALGSRGVRSWRGGWVLSEHGFGAPEMVLFGWKWGESFTVMREVEGAKALWEYIQGLQEEKGGCEKTRRRWEVMVELGRTVGGMHGRGVAHGDLRWGNIFVRTGGEGGIKFVFLDNERTKKYRRLPARKRLKNLVQLNMVPGGLLGRTDKMRFWQAYLKENPALKSAQREWGRQVLAKTANRIRGRC